MAENSKIEWCDHTFNPWRGCTKVSPGCANCYAATMSKRNPATLGVWGDSGTRVVASEAQWKLPLKWNREAEKRGVRARVFCGSMMDVLEGYDTMPVIWAERIRRARARLIEVIDWTESIDWLLLTKRPQNLISLLKDAFHLLGVETLQMAENWWNGKPPHNVWLGTSVENQDAADERIPHLLKTPAAVRFLSCEPLLGPVNIWSYDNTHIHTPQCYALTAAERQSACPPAKAMAGIHWVICGGESGHGARPCHLDWIRSIVRQCRDAGVACFVKQLGSAAEHTVVVPHDGNYTSETQRIRLRDSKGGDWSEWPEDLRLREFPKGVTT